MISVSEAVKLIQKNKIILSSQDIDMENLGALKLATDVVADREYPPFDRVMMDGIAISHKAYTEGLRSFVIEGVAPAGEAEKTLSSPENCLEVMTGAPLPRNADLVVPYEEITISNQVAEVENLERSYFANIHEKGSDIKTGELQLKAGTLLNSPHWGIVTSFGADKLQVKKSPRINIISTGDELVDWNESPLKHQIRRSNVFAIKAALTQFSYQNITTTHLDDDMSAIDTHFKEATKQYDILIYSGGVSKGKFDYLPSVWDKNNVRKVFHRVAQRPGKPLWFGIDDESKTTIFGLPGNPVSSLVCLYRYFLTPKTLNGVLLDNISFSKKLTAFMPVRLESLADGRVGLMPLKMKNSGEFTALAMSDGFIELDAQTDHFHKGDIVKFTPWGIL